MKAKILLAAATFTITAATAQHRQSSVVFNEQTPQAGGIYEPQQLLHKPVLTRGKNIAPAAARTTTDAHSRWYNYGDYLAATVPYAFSAMYLWNDSTSVDVYTGDHSSTVFKYNNMASVGYVCDPFFPLWNDIAAYPGLMHLTPAEAYIIDSVYISGIYMRNNLKTEPVDTLIIAIIYGDGSNGSDLHYRAIDTSGGRSWIYNEYSVDTLHYMNMKHDSTNNRADTFMGGFPPVVKKFYLINTDTSSNFEMVIPVSINVPAGGNIPAVSLSFKSGDTSFVAGDTVFFGSTSLATPYKYGMFRPFIAYSGASGVPAFPVNSKFDMNEGEFRDIGYDRAANGLYRPHWFWYNASTGGAATYQYPYFAFHLTCPTCSAVALDNAVKETGSIIVYPNPANTTVTVAWANMRTADVTITNIMGQQVATQKGVNGSATFSTDALPQGIYLYTVTDKGARATGRIIVSH